MKKIVIASDSFKGSLSSAEVAACGERAVHRLFPDCKVVQLPVADGGEGTVETLTAALGGQSVTAIVHDPLGRLITARYGWIAQEQTALIEMAAASGLPLLPLEERNPWLTSTYGTGELIRNALERGCHKFLIAIGGSATNDGGMGLLQALGFRFLDAEGKELPGCGGSLQQIQQIDSSGVLVDLAQCQFTVACDVTNPFYGPTGAAYVFAPQKGADAEMVEALDQGLRHFAQLIHTTQGIAIDQLAGAGAAGGLGGGLVAFLNARLTPGIEMVLDALRFDTQITGADLIITGEGKLDAQTCMGKTPLGILRRAQQQGIPVVALGGAVEASEALNQCGFLAVFPILPYPTSLTEAMDSSFTQQNIERTIAQVLRLFSAFSSI
ncbi:MAG: glycerate kinase [bacterium]|nr:glycerate kinase [Parabacteroides sp.]MCI7009654.1 glycerate kinase [Parabacteroides sp.]MDD6080229.1 glycerate kinase [bacterium]